MATNGAGKARIRTRIRADFIMRCGDSEYVRPGVEVGPMDTENQYLLNFVFSLIFQNMSSKMDFKKPRSVKQIQDRRSIDLVRPEEGQHVNFGTSGRATQRQITKNLPGPTHTHIYIYIYTYIRTYMYIDRLI